MKALRLLFLAVAGMLFSGVFLLRAQGEAVDFSLRAVMSGEKTAAVCWQYSFPDDCYYLFLPACAEGRKVLLETDAASLLLDGNVVDQNGIALSEGAHTVAADGREAALFVLRGGDLPSLFIETASGSDEAIRADKNVKEAGSASLFENGKAVFTARPLEYVKGRGNSTWEHRGKKPFNIKFEEKTALLGMESAKKWCLLANAFDATLLRNTVGLSVARTLSVPYAVDASPVDLYLNGLYAGCYLLTESVQVGAGRVEITDLEKLNESANPGVSLASLPAGGLADAVPGGRKWVEAQGDPADLTGGYLLEFDFPDRYGAEACGFVSARGQCVVIKSPAYATKAEVNYIADLYQEMEDAVFSPDGTNAAGKHYSAYLDVKSFAAMYLTLEIAMNFDGCASSFFLSKNAGEARFTAGPAWDYDLSLGNYRQEKLNRALAPDAWIVRENPLIAQDGGCEENLTVALCRQPDFWREAQALWEAEGAAVQAGAAQIFSKEAALLAPSAVMDKIRWGGLGGASAAAVADDYMQAAAALSDKLQKRFAALEKGFPSPAVMPDVSSVDFSRLPAAVGETSYESPLPSLSPAQTAQAEETTLQASAPETERARAGVTAAAVAAGLAAAGVGVVVFCRRRRGAEAKTGQKGEIE